MIKIKFAVPQLGNLAFRLKAETYEAYLSKQTIMAYFSTSYINCWPISSRTQTIQFYYVTNLRNAVSLALMYFALCSSENILEGLCLCGQSVVLTVILTSDVFLVLGRNLQSLTFNSPGQCVLTMFNTLVMHHLASLRR